MALAGKVGAVYVQTSAAPVAFTDEATTKNGDFTRYTITSAAKKYWDLSTPVTVKKNGTVITTGFTVEYAGGVIVFNPALITTDVVLVSGNYVTVAQAGGFYNWSVDASMDMAETTAFGDGAKTFTPMLLEWSGSAEAYWGDERFFTAIGSRVVLVLYADNTANKVRYEGHAFISGDGIEADMADVIKETINFQGCCGLYYRAG